MATSFEKIVSATEFKAKCLELMDQLGQRKLDRVIVTKRGRVVMEAVPPSLPADDTETRDELPALFGCMKGTVTVPDDFDWEAPMYTDAELDGFLTETERQIFEPDAP